MAGAEAPLDSEAATRLEGLQDKLRELQEQGAAEFAKATAGAEAAADGATAQQEDSDDGGEVEIDSGSDDSDDEDAGEDEEAEEGGRQESHDDAGGSLMSP